ncbi:hypothetical protein AVV36_gp109 [Pectobacterium bacteriophage PM2]|uniref:Uncharacterized protein n=1 Tax=Pectobacterium bacteriophage PM2 TaxID=1429794 RepID=A0A0A0Q0E5_9CAUD|nr:hypothetical protein AVV36_gp109 [Pectobacterium bacteriophage PM2]AHY25071.1 hypothetical protein PM2_109 [Pectobacterium bacteriophage PM2]
MSITYFDKTTATVEDFTFGEKTSFNLKLVEVIHEQAKGPYDVLVVSGTNGPEGFTEMSFLKSDLINLKHYLDVVLSDMRNAE